MQKTLTGFLFTGAGAIAAMLHLAATAATPEGAPTQLLTKYNCQGCHQVDKRVVGPSYKEVAAKYASDGSALAKLEQKVKGGGGGVWGAIPMPPTNAPDADLKTLVEWIL